MLAECLRLNERVSGREVDARLQGLPDLRRHFTDSTHHHHAGIDEVGSTLNDIGRLSIRREEGLIGRGVAVLLGASVGLPGDVRSTPPHIAPFGGLRRAALR